MKEDNNMGKINKAIRIFKEELSEAKGKFRLRIFDVNRNEVDVFDGEGNYYCTVVLSTGQI